VKKKLMIFLITLLTVLPLMELQPLTVQAAYSFSGGGDGSSENPYLIQTAEDLDHVRDDMASSYKLQANIDFLSDYGNWDPIGTDSNEFIGQFDGTGYTISGMNINSNAYFIGLFGSMIGSTTTAA
jgi:hypothetical protein